MKQTEQTLLEQMRITDFEISHRQQLLGLTEEDFHFLHQYRGLIEGQIDGLVDIFYQLQTNVAEIALLIGDADTLERLRSAQRKYVLDLFSGVYDIEYVNNRLRIGLVHKRIGVEPKLYLAAVNTLKRLLFDLIEAHVADDNERRQLLEVLDRLFLFDITLVFETYIRSLVMEIDISREKSENYARVLEEKVKERTRQLEEMTRTDPLTGLNSVRSLHECLTRALRAAQRRGEPISIAYLDVNDFKQINDTQGHQRGDEILHLVGTAIRSVSRMEDQCFRYGGDEFCIILPSCREEEACELYISRLSAELAKKLPGVRLSVGIVQTGPDAYAEPEWLIREADKRMYAAKKVLKAVPGGAEKPA